ncbi:MAG: exodeoxyribonuclease VII large subunit [Desulfovibrio sp.]|jgi:exodeoxyribonuclease VII large subunit|nr:exodeoxyribonuclease VII large subunit [Desulfovibrio sp.]
MNDDRILSVSALTEAVKKRLEGAFAFVWVRGQVTNLSRSASGHVFFALRDEHSTLAAVWFKGDIRPAEHFDPLTGEIYEDGPRPGLALSLENGQEIVCAGRLSLYAPRGIYRLIVEYAAEQGTGRLHEEFLRLRAKLAAEGVFAPERKRPLPVLPRRVALVTSPQGAAVHDFLRLSMQRGPGAEFRIYPVPVQGEGAPLKIIEAVRRTAAEGWAEVLVLLRGGGSLEDLRAFNNEDLALAVYRSPIPVLAGIGHEVDFTLSDLAADVRAATPSHAAQILLPERAELYRSLADLRAALQETAERRLERASGRFADLANGLRRLSPRRTLQARRSRLAAELRLLLGAGRLLLQRDEARLKRACAELTAWPERLKLKAASLEHLILRLEALDPHAPLQRGYATARKADGRFVRRIDDVLPGEALTLTVTDGDIVVRVEGIQAVG